MERIILSAGTHVWQKWESRQHVFCIITEELGSDGVRVYTRVECVIFMLLSITHYHFWQRETCLQLGYILTMDQSRTRY